MPEPLHALTLWQPWADLIVDGIKPVENRPWAPPAWLKGRLFAIHAGLTYDRDCAEDCAAGLYSPNGRPIVVEPKASIVLGAIVGLARLDFWESKEPSLLMPVGANPWFFGPFGWWLSDVVRIEPVYCRGAQKLWRAEGQTLEAVRVNYRAALGRQEREAQE